MKLSNIIIKYRTENELSQREFAKRCGLSNSYISFIEKESNPKTKRPMAPSLERYKQLADGMGISVQSLFEMLDDDVPVSLSYSPVRLDPDERQLLSAFRAADDRAREDALKTLLDHPRKKDTESSAI